jgi:ferredoxin-NADP reductase
MSNWIHDRLGEGVLVRCFGPSGHFTAGPPPSPGPRRLLPVVGGSGIVPLQAVARQVLHDEPQAEVTLVYGSSALERAFFAAALQQRVRDDAPCLRLHWVFESAPAEGCGQAITLPPGDTLLEAALTAGIAPPFSCRSGGCRACRVRITDQLQHVALDEPNAVRPDDLARGEVPACLVRPNGPCRFRLP